MTAAMSLAKRLADEIQNFPLGRCGPSDDPDKQYAYTASFRDVAKRFVGAVKRVGDPDLSSMVTELDLVPDGIVEAHDLRAELLVVIDVLEAVSRDPNYGPSAASNSAFLNPDVLIKLSAVRSTRLDTSKLVRMCEELNDAYGRGNFISSALLLRAVLNHVPPIFAVLSFSEVVASAGRSIKAVLSRLNDDARPIADLHTHLTMRPVEHVPTKNQLEPYKPGFEVLIQEVISKLSDDKG